MRVRKLEVFGFKSFAQKTTLHFEPGVTAIVGPNGSGKSNIVDSIRWVLGEHNPRDVRAPRLEDVIFNGTDRRAPLSMAEVQLTIDNERGLLPMAFTEVTVARRVYRSGESECFINQSPCRLKDIQELFLGTGLGGGSYAIIEQGHIDMILSSRPEERRLPFEEASGVAKYLAKKQETMRRLEEVETHLVRIADIISEVRRQLAALERAANKARQYQTQWDGLKRLEVRLAVDELGAGEARAVDLAERQNTLATQREQLEAEKQRHMASLEACNAAVSMIQRRLEELRTKVVECASRVEQHESQGALKARWVEELTVQVKQLEADATYARTRIAQVDEQRASASGGQTEIQAQLASAQEALTRLQGELAALEGASQAAVGALAAAKAQLFETASDASHHRNQLQQVTSRLQALEAQCSRLETQHTQRASHVGEVQTRQEAVRGESEALRKQEETVRRRILEIGQVLEAAGARRHELSGRLHQLREQLARERAQVALLEDLWRHYEGFPDAVKRLMGQSIEGLLGPLVDIVQAAPGYEELIEAALGPLAEALVVKDRAALRRCREVLSGESMGGCRFLVLSDCPQEAVQMNQPSGGVAGAVKEHVRTDPIYQPLVDWLLNDSWVVDDIQRWVAESQVPTSRLVSPRGDRWDRRSWRFGDARSSAQGRVGRKQRWMQTQATLHALEQEFGWLEGTSAQAEQEYQSLQREQESAKGELAQVSVSLQARESSMAQLTHEAGRLEQEQRAFEAEAQELTARREELRTETGRLQREVAEAQERHQAREHALAEAQAAREALEQRRQQATMTQAQSETLRASLTQRLEALEARCGELESERSHLQQQLEAKTLQRQEATSRAQELSQQQETHRLGSQEAQEARGHLEREAGSVEEALRAEEAKRDQALPHLLAVEQQLSSIMRQMQEQEQQLSEGVFRRSRLVERLQELYQIDEATLRVERQAQPAPLSGEERTALSEQIQKLRAKLEGLGPVSLGSVEEYDELKRRQEFLQTQQQDLQQARDDLKTSITQINRTARTQFRETFDRIKQEFMHYYTRLFDGGQADLILMDEEDVLECGIDIVARPPGKRLQSISLLSGGERALTAVALLFALFKVRPSPFCILDEIDAPLDEANVDRFTRVLEEFLALSQFILITHNKKTITRADSLYGVTMEEPGISKILSARLATTNQAPPTPAPAGVTS